MSELVSADRFRVPRWGLFYGFLPADGWSEVGRIIETSVFVDSLGYTEELVRDEYEPYESTSVWVVLTNLEQRVAVGAVRVLLGERDELKLGSDFPSWWGKTLDQALTFHGGTADQRVAECATVSVAPGWRGADSHWPVRALCAGLGTLLVDVGATWCVQLQDVAGLPLMIRRLGLRFEVLGNVPPVDFLGPVIPTVTHVPTHFDPVAEHADPDFVALYRDRDETVRGGTLLPSLDLTGAVHRMATLAGGRVRG